MEKLYLIEGTNQVLIDRYINKLIDNNDLEIIKYNLEEKTIDDVIETLDTYDMFARRKIVIATNPTFYSNLVEDFNKNKFLKYLENPSDNTLIIIVNKLNNRLKIVKETINYFNYIKVDDIDINSFIKENIKDYKMDLNTISYFIKVVGTDFSLVENELNKLKLFKLDNKIIEKKDIDLICRHNFENTIFDLIDAIIKREKSKVINLYNYFLESGTEVFQILILLSNQIRLMYNVKVLNNLRDSEIADILDVKEYPVKLARGKGYSYKEEELLKILYNLGVIDEDIKSGKQIPDISLISYILKI